MAAIRLDTFGGLLPKISDRLLPTSNATVAKNTQLYSGELRGLHTPSLQASFSGDPLTRVFRLADQITWAVYEDSSVNFLKAPLINDSYNRYYWSGGNQPPQFSEEVDIIAASGSALDGTGIALGVPAPATPPTVTPTVVVGDLETRAYVYTHVNIYGEESAPSPPSDPIAGDIASQWDITNMDNTYAVSPPDGGYQWGELAEIRIYRTVTGAQTVDYRYVDSTFSTPSDPGPYVAPDDNYDDNEDPDDVSLNEAVGTIGWALPPFDSSGSEPNLEGIVVLPNGVLAGFLGRDLYLSEPYRPHAWPTDYILSVDFDIVGLGVYHSGLIVCTKANPYVISGAHPLNMTMVKLDDVEPCLSFRSIVSATDGVFYASQNGLVQVTESGAAVVTKELINRNEWRTDYSPNSVYGALLGDNYIGFYTQSQGFVVDRGNQLAALYDLSNFAGVQAIQTDPFSGEVFYIRSNEIYLWNPPDTPPLYYMWKSKEFETPRPVNFGAFKIKFAATTDEPDEPYEPPYDYLTYNTARIGNSPATGTTTPLDTFNSRAINMVTQMYDVGVPANEFGDPYPAPPPDQTRSPMGGSVLRPEYGSSILTDGVVLTIWADRAIIFSGTITDQNQHRLPSGSKADIWQVELQSAAHVYSFAMAEAGKELATT